MQIIANSKYFKANDDVSMPKLKQSVIEKLRHSFHVETVGEGVETFSVNVGGRRKFAGATLCHMTLNMSLAHEKETVRLQMNGRVEVTNSAKMMYALGVLMVLLIGLFPGSIDTSSDGGPLDALIFLIIGGFIMYDMNQKLAEMESLLADMLDQVETEFVQVS